MRTLAVALCLAAVALALPARATVSIQQLGAATPRQIKFYVDVTDSTGNPVTELRGEQLVVRGSGDVQLLSVRKFDPTDGVAYIVLVDASMSFRSRQQAMRDALQNWIHEMTDKDRMAIVSFGNSVQLRQDFTSNQLDLLAASVISAKEQNTYLYKAFQKAAELARRLDRGLPERRAIMVLSDGMNDERETGLSADDIARDLAGNGTPVFAIDSGPARKNRGSDCSQTLARFATVSSGLCEPLNGRSIAETFAHMRAAIGRVYVVGVRCDKCPADGVARDFWMEVTVGATVQRSNSRLVVLNSDPERPPSPVVPDDAQDQRNRSMVWWVGGLAFLALLCALGYWRWGRRPKVVPDSEIDLAPVTHAPPPVSKATLQFVVMGGAHSGRLYEAALHESVVLGSGLDCQVRISDDAEVSEKHCEFSWVNNAVYVRDLAHNASTLVGGAQLRTPRLLEDREVMRVGRTQMRVRISTTSGNPE